MRRQLAWLWVTALACNGSDSKDGSTPDTEDTEDSEVDPVIDLNGELAFPQDADGEIANATPGVAVDLIAREAIDPAGDRDFFAIDLKAGEPYQIWVDTGANLLCDTFMYIYPPGATTAATASEQDGSVEIDRGDAIAWNDDMIYRYSESDPGIVFVPPSDGRYVVQVMEYNHAVSPEADTWLGGPWCSYKLRGMRRDAFEVEPNGASDVATATFPALRPNPFQTAGEEFSGWLSSATDADLWRFQFGQLPEPEGGSFWMWSLWPTQPGEPAVRMTLLDSDLQVLAETTSAVPDGHHAFVDDPGILFPVASNATYYLKVEPAGDPSVTSSPLYYVGVAHGYGPGLVRCDIGGGDDGTPWIDVEPNNDLREQQALRFCQVGSSDVYVAHMSGQLDPTGLETRWVPVGPSDDTATRSDPEVDCPGIRTCPDRDNYSVTGDASTGGLLSERRLTVAVQAATVGSLVEPEVYLFADDELVFPFASSADASYREPSVRLGDPDAVIQTTIPADAETVRVLVQARTLSTDNPTANRYYMRVVISD